MPGPDVPTTLSFKEKESPIPCIKGDLTCMDMWMHCYFFAYQVIFHSFLSTADFSVDETRAKCLCIQALWW